jgi:predicted small metal-binding protein
MKFLRCRDAGFDCDAVIRAETEEDVLRQAAEHARTVHNLSEVSKQAVVKIRSLISDEIPQVQNVVPK